MGREKDENKFGSVKTTVYICLRITLTDTDKQSELTGISHKLNNMTALDYIRDWSNNTHKIADVMEAYAKLYHAEQVNSVDLADVSQQRELLIAYHKHNTIIRDEVVDRFIENHVDEYLSNL